MKTRLLVLLVVAAALVCGMSPAANAQNGNCGYGGYGWLYNSLQYNVPHFAAFPPVYYSYPVPRTYGFSPFAYPPGVMTPDPMGEAPQPLEIINPHVPAAPSTESAPPAKSDTTAAVNAQPQPLVILNPFVTSEKSLAADRAIVARQHSAALGHEFVTPNEPPAEPATADLDRGLLPYTIRCTAGVAGRVESVWTGVAEVVCLRPGTGWPVAVRSIC